MLLECAKVDEHDIFFTRTMQNTEKGRKISSAAASTGRAVAQTSKAVGKIFFLEVVC